MVSLLHLSTNSIYWLSIPVASFMSWAIGAQDVSNAVGTSVGSGALSANQAAVLAGIFEFCGALVGGNVSETISKGIIPPVEFATPTEYAKAMLATLLGSAIWLLIATLISLPISTTHSLIGALVGIGLCFLGPSALAGSKLLETVLSWVVSPVLGFVLGFSSYFMIKKLILDRRKSRFTMVKIAFLLIITCTVFLTFFLMNLKVIYEIPPLIALALAVGISSILAMIYFCWMTASQSKASTIELISFSSREIEDKVAGDAREVTKTAQINNSEIEENFRLLMVITACAVAFAHGSNDVNNAIGPFAGITEANESSTTAEVEEDSYTIPIWIFIFGGLGIVVGIVTYGHRIIKTVGKKITPLSYSRGFAAQISAALVVLLATFRGLPISTTHCVIGAVTGVGLVDSKDAINIKILKKIVVTWVVTFPAAALLGILVYMVF